MSHKTKTLKLEVIPKLIIPIELPEDPESDGDETITLDFEVKRQTLKNHKKTIADSKDITASFHNAEIDEMEYSELMLGLICEKTHWVKLKNYDLLYINRIMKHIQEQTEEFKKKHSGSAPSKT